MANTARRHLLNIILLSAATAFYVSCKKSDIIKHVQTPTSSFIVKTSVYNLPSQTTNYIDSNFYFKNFSDSSAVISYKWNFGDGSTSTSKNPKHKYSKRGKYTVSLTVNNDNKVSDVSKTVLTVVLGQKTISFGTSTNTQAVDIIETADKGFLVLGKTGSVSVTTQTFFLMKTDSLYNQLSVKNFSSLYYFNSIQPTTDGNYILTGSTTATTSPAATQELIKMGGDGIVLWSKILTGSDNITSAQQTPDGGYLVVGNNKNVGGYGAQYTTVTKTDNNGIVMWTRSFMAGNILQGTVNVVLESDGIVFAGTTPNISNLNCSSCDSLMIIKLNNDGSNKWQSTTPWGLNHMGVSAKIAKAGDGNYNVIPINGTNGVYFFSPQGAFLNRSLVTSACYNNSITNDGGIIILQSAFNNGPRSYISKLDLHGTTLWSTYFYTQQDYPVTSHALRNGGSIILCNKQDYIPNTYSYYTSIALLQLADDGSTM